MFAFVIALVVAVAGLAVAAVLGRFSGQLAEPTRTSCFESFAPDRPVEPADVDAMAFDQTLRGYRMGQVDLVLDRLREEIEWRDERIAELERRVPAAGAHRARD